MAACHGRIKVVTTAAEFMAELKKNELAKPPKLTVVDWSTEWCGPCRMMLPKLAKISEAEPTVTFLSMDADKLSEEASKHDIDSFPTFEFYRGKTQVEAFCGANEAKLKSCIAKYK